MNAEIEAHLPEIKELCERYGVIKLELFGSATRSDFNPETSDFDIFVDFAERGPGTGYADRFFGFIRELQELFERKLDIHSSHLHDHGVGDLYGDRVTIYETDSRRLASRRA